jgi:sialidase-1
VFDLRHKNAADLPADIDVGLMRSADDGATWQPMQKIMDFDVTEPNAKGNGVGDPAVLVDKQTGTIFVTALYSYGNRSWYGSGPGLTREQTGQLMLVESQDDGMTWSKPRSLTDQIKLPEWRLCFQGPGNGIQMENGTLVFPAQFKAADNVPHSCFIASKDHGKTWTISPAATPAHPTSESAIAEATPHWLLLSMRDEKHSGKRAWATWEWRDDVMKGAWSEPKFEIPDPTCMGSLIRHPNGTLLFSNANHATQRIALTIRSSTDTGNTWSAGKLLDARPCAYSCMTVLRDGSIGILYETGVTNPAEQLEFARFPLSWLAN